MSRTSNIDRMRRHVARTTPDVVRRQFDSSSWEYDHEYHEWLKTFARRMATKHPGSTIHLTAAPADPRNPGLFEVEARVQPRETRPEETAP